MVAKFMIPLTLTCMLVLHSGCKKEDEKNLIVSNAEVTFDYEQSEKTITISDVGSSGFTWSVSTPSDMLEFSKTSGSCSKNNPDKFVITLLRQKVHQDSISTNITITASTGETASVSLLILGFPEKKIRYNSPILDVEFDRIHNRLIILASTSSSRLLDIFDLTTNTFSHIPLPGTGSLLSVSSDGTYAVTSSNDNTRITFTDLIQKKVINTFSVGQFTDDIIAGPGKYCYYFPYYTDADIGKLDLSNGNFNSYNCSSYIDLDMAALHPTGKYIYTVGYYLSKFIISDSVPELVYSNTSYDPGSKLWISGEGTKLFTSGRKLFNIDPSLPQNDITSVQDVPIGQNYIYWFDHNMVHNEFYIIPTNSSYGADYQSSQVLVLGSDLSPLYTVHLEPFYINDNYNTPGYETEEAVGEYVFSSSDGDKIIVVSRAYEYYSYIWGIEIIERNWK